MARMSAAAIAAQEQAQEHERLIAEALAALTQEQRDLLEKREVEVLIGYKCEDCDEVCSEDELDTLYECSECGSKGVGADEGRRCDDCNKFRARLDDKHDQTGCTRCGEGQTEPVVVIDPDGSGDLVEIEEGIEQVEDLAADEDGDADLVVERTERKRRADLSPDPVVITEEVPATTLKAGDWYRTETRTAGGTDTVITRTVELRNDARVDGEHVILDHRVLTGNSTVQKVVRWERPEAAYDIKASELTLMHVVCDPNDWSTRGRMSFTSIHTDLATGQVTGFNKYRRKAERDAPEATYAPDDTVVVVDRDSDSLFGRPAFEVWWDVSIGNRYQPKPGDGLDFVPNPRSEEFFRRLEAAGLPTQTHGRKHHISETGKHKHINDGKPYARFQERKPRQALALIQVLRDMDLKPTAIVQTTNSR